MTCLISRPLAAALLVGAIGVFTLAGCCQNCSTSSTRESEKPSEVAASATTPVAFVQDGWGDITGRIVWNGGAVPAPAAIAINNNPDGPACQKNGPVPDETWVVNEKNKGVRDVFVWLDAKKKGDKLPIHESLKDVKPAKVELDQPACAFIAHAVGLREGQILVVKNSASIGHNFKWSGNPETNPGGNVLLPPGASRDIDDLKADRLPVRFECNIHPWMNGWCRVYDHPYFAVTDADGNFTIKNAPVGDFNLKIWHSQGWNNGAAGKNGQPIEVKSGENKLGDVTFTPPKAS